MIYLSTAIGLPPGGSSTVHIYTQTVHRTTQWKRTPRIQNGTYITIRIHKHNNKNIQTNKKYITIRNIFVVRPVTTGNGDGEWGWEKGRGGGFGRKCVVFSGYTEGCSVKTEVCDCYKKIINKCVGVCVCVCVCVCVGVLVICNMYTVTLRLPWLRFSVLFPQL